MCVPGEGVCPPHSLAEVHSVSSSVEAGSHLHSVERRITLIIGSLQEVERSSLEKLWVD